MISESSMKKGLGILNAKSGDGMPGDGRPEGPGTSSGFGREDIESLELCEDGP